MSPTPTTKRRAPRAQATTIDFRLLSMLRTFAGNDVDSEYFDLAVRHAVAGAQAMLSSTPLSTAFDEYVDRPSTYELASDAVEAWMLTHDPVLGKQKRALVEMLRAVNSLSHEEPITINDQMDLHVLLIRFAEAGLFLGAALAFSMIHGQGGAR